MRHIVQLTLDGNVAEPRCQPRTGCIGKVERLINERPWLVCGDIAAGISEPVDRVSNCLNKLKLEGKAQFQVGLGERRKSVWAGTTEAGRELREIRLHEIIAESDAKMALLAGDRLAKGFARSGAPKLDISA
jgi:hypothetical protein